MRAKRFLSKRGFSSTGTKKVLGKNFDPRKERRYDMSLHDLLYYLKPTFHL